MSDALTDKKLKDRFTGWAEAPEACEVWPTGSVFVDWLTGVGGLPKGRVVETYGPESSGKSTLGLQCAAEVWRRYEIPSVYADFENALDFKYATALGLTPESLLVENPDTLEDYLEGVLHMVNKGTDIALSICDSVASATTRKGLGSGVDDRTEGMEKARVWTMNLGRMVKPLRQSGITLLLVNQTRAFIDTSPGFKSPGMVAMQPKETTPGGKGIKFYASMRLRFGPRADIREERINPFTREPEKVAVGKKVRIDVTKNKVWPPPWRNVQLAIRDGRGFDEAENLFEFALTHALITKGTGGKYTFPQALFDGDADYEVGPVDGTPGTVMAVEAIRQIPQLADGITDRITATLASEEAAMRTKDQETTPSENIT